MNKLLSYFLLSLLSFPAFSNNQAPPDYWKKIKSAQQQKLQCIKEKQWKAAPSADAEYRQLILKNMPFIFKDLSRFSNMELIQMADYIRKLPDEDYLQAVQKLAEGANAVDPLHQRFLEKVIFDPFEGPRDNFFALNWRNRQIRDICKELDSKLSPGSPARKQIADILSGQQFQAMIAESLEGATVRIPSRLSREGYAPLFREKQTGPSEKQQRQAILNLQKAWNAACTLTLAMDGEKDLSKTVEAWKSAIAAGQNVMSLQPPASEEEQQSLGQFFYENAFLQYSNLSPFIHQPESMYGRVSQKLASLKEKKEYMPLIETILSFFHTMAQPDSYLNEEALYLHSEPMRQKIRKERLFCDSDES